LRGDENGPLGVSTRGLRRPEARPEDHVHTRGELPPATRLRRLRPPADVVSRRQRRRLPMQAARIPRI
jgi:hypothetical protein